MDESEHESWRMHAENKFNQYVSEAIDHIPEMYQDKMKSIAITVDDQPSPEQRKKLGLRKCDALFGLYEGVPLPKRGGNTLSIQPDVITIFKYPMIDAYKNEESLKKQIYKTLWHEVAHFFGLNHREIYAVEKQTTKP